MLVLPGFAEELTVVIFDAMAVDRHVLLNCISILC